MRILIISFGHIDSVIELSRGLSSTGHQVILVLTVYGKEFINSTVRLNLVGIAIGLSPISYVSRDPESKLFVDYISSNVDCRLLKLPSRSLHDFSCLKIIRQFCSEARDLQPDVIHFNGDSAQHPVFHYFLQKYPSVYSIHDYEPHSGESNAYHRIKNRFFKHYLFEVSQALIVHSHYSREIILKKSKLDPSTLFVTYFAPFNYYYNYTEKPVREEFPTILFFGRISPYKGIRYFCEAIPEIHRKFPYTRFVVLGRGTFDFDIQYYIDRYPLSVINAYIDNQTLADHIRKASLTILPYTDATQSGVIMTSFTFDKPVIATRVGGLPEVIQEGETGVLVEPKDPVDIAEKLCNLLDQPERIREMQHRVATMKLRTDIPYANWENVANETLKAYSWAVSRTHGEN